MSQVRKIKNIIYQIYPVSFKDTKNTGKGDLQGIIQKLEYIKSLNVDYIWLTPIFKSPFKDNGYDISNYFEINPDFGTMQDLKELVKSAKKYNLKIMLDMVFNHTSTECEWFKKWLNKDPEYKDFYISKYSEKKPPNNWKSKFGGSAWKEYKKNYWYLHLFDETQADLNWNNKEVRKKIKSVIDFYLNLGIKGFRFDVINLISKSTYIEDETDGRKFYTDGPKVHDYLKELRTWFPIDEDFLTVGELSSTNVKDASKYSHKNKEELDSVFMFYHLKIDYDKKGKFIYKKPNIRELNDVLKFWFENSTQLGGNLASFLNNHDQPRSVSRFIDKNFHSEGAKMLCALMLSLPGDFYLFQGEEIAMENPYFENKRDYRDVETLNHFLKINSTKATRGIKQKSRDNSRTPMQWNDSKNAGFSEHNPWINLSPSFKKYNVKNEIQDPHSVLSFYKFFISEVKHNDLFSSNSLEFLPYSKNLIRFTKKWNNKTYHFCFSFSNKDISYNLKDMNILYSNYEASNNILKPYQFVIGEYLAKLSRLNEK